MYQGDRPGLTDKVNVVAQRTRTGQAQLATDVVPRSAFSNVGDLVVGYGPGQPDPLMLGEEGSVLTASPHEAGGMRWARPDKAASGIGATAVIAGTTPDSGTYPVSSRGALLTTHVDNGSGVVPYGTFNVFGDIDGRWFSFTGGPLTVEIAADSVLYSRLEAVVAVPHAGGVLLPDRFCWASTRRLETMEPTPGIDVRPDLDSPVQLDDTFEEQIGHGTDLYGWADWAYASSTAIFAAAAGTVLGIKARMMSATTSGNGTLCKAALSLVRLGRPSTDTPDDFFL